MKKSKDIDTYISSYPEEVQLLLQKMRTTIKKAAPKAEEAISYGIPTYKLNGNLVHFGAFKDHVSFFPTSSGTTAFKKEIAKYKVSKGTIQFPLDKPLPLPLITKIVRFRVRESLKKIIKICSRGHKFYKSSDCPTCPLCWPGRYEKIKSDFPATLSAPALRALNNNKITSLKKLTSYTEKEILELHGMGPASLPKLRTALKPQGLSFKK